MKRALIILIAIGATRLGAAAWYGRDASAWLDGDEEVVQALSAEMVGFENADSATRATDPENRFAGEWALVTHQMTAHR